jgi:hypothetical protein
MEAFGIPITNSPFRAEPPLKFPVIDESLLPTKETTA